MSLTDVIIGVNNDLEEPLNFHHYITDISVFGADSYVLDVSNEKLWRQLISSSLAVFGNDSIHDYIYARLTAGDVDHMMRNHSKLGLAFNSFYNAPMFSTGDMDAVLNTLTSEKYNILDKKFQDGINRYISEKTAGDTAGEWLGAVFDSDALKAKSNMASIVSDTVLWNNVIMQDVSMRYVVCLSAATIDWFAENESDAYVQFITEVCNSTQAAMDFFDALESGSDGEIKLSTFMDTESVVTVMASNAESMTAVIYSIAPFAAMIASETAMATVAASETAMDVIIDGITNAANSETVLAGIKDELTSIESTLPSIANTETVIAEVASTKTVITGTVAKIQAVTSQADILAENIYKLAQSSAALLAMLSNSTIGMKILYLPPVLNGICKYDDISSLVSQNYNLDADTVYDTISTSAYFKKVSYDGISKKYTSNGISGTSKLYAQNKNVIAIFNQLTAKVSNTFSATVTAKIFDAFGKIKESVSASTSSSETYKTINKNISVVTLRNASVDCNNLGGSSGSEAVATVRSGVIYEAL